MTIKELRDIYDGSSTKASDINRKLIFAGIAIVWIFRKTTELNVGEIFPEEFKPILLLFCISLCMDVIQYIIRASMWHVYYHFHRVPEEEEQITQAKEPEWLNAFPDSFWYAKFVPTLLAYLNIANLMTITSIKLWGMLESLSGWRVLSVWGLILSFLTLWYVAVEIFYNNESHNVNCTTRCFRLTLGVAIAIISFLFFLGKM